MHDLAAPANTGCTPLHHAGSAAQAVHCVMHLPLKALRHAAAEWLRSARPGSHSIRAGYSQIKPAVLPLVSVMNPKTYRTHLTLKALLHAPGGWSHSASPGSPSRSGGHRSAPRGCAAGLSRWRTHSPSVCLPMAESPPGPPPARHTGSGFGDAPQQRAVPPHSSEQCRTSAARSAAPQQRAVPPHSSEQCRPTAASMPHHSSEQCRTTTQPGANSAAANSSALEPVLAGVGAASSSSSGGRGQHHAYTNVSSHDLGDRPMVPHECGDALARLHIPQLNLSQNSGRATGIWAGWASKLHGHQGQVAGPGLTDARTSALVDS